MDNHSQPRYERVTGTLGAIVHGVDPADGFAPLLASGLTEALHVHGVLFFHASRPFDNDAYEAFARNFGEVRAPERNRTGADSRVTSVDSEVTSPEMYRVNCWHTDVAWQECPPQAATLKPEILPAVGGDTMWASMYAAWDALSARYQQLLDGLEAVQSTAALIRQCAADIDPTRFGPANIASAVHPVVLRDPVTQRRMLYVNSNWTDRIVGMKPTESAQLIQMLNEHVNTPEFHVRLRWTPNTVAVWDQRVTQHRAVSDYTGQRRLLRTTIIGDKPRA